MAEVNHSPLQMSAQTPLTDSGLTACSQLRNVLPEDPYEYRRGDVRTKQSTVISCEVRWLARYQTRSAFSTVPDRDTQAAIWVFLAIVGILLSKVAENRYYEKYYRKFGTTLMQRFVRTKKTVGACEVGYASLLPDFRIPTDTSPAGVR